jgi:guanylate kinase
MLISLCGPSGIGKGHIKKQILKAYPLIKELQWFTTRTLRPDEKNGNRVHVSPKKFKYLVNHDKLVLVQNLYGHFYGLKKNDLRPIKGIAITEIHPDNLGEAFKINPAIIAIGLITSDFSILYERLAMIRKTEGSAEIKQRIKKAKNEIKTIKQRKTLFASLIEISKKTENSAFSQVIKILKPHLPNKGE